MTVYFTSRRALAALVMATCAVSPAAWAADKFYAPYVEKGELEVEYFGSRTVDGDSSKDNAQKQKFALGYGVNDYWATEISANYAKESGGNMKFDNVEWENIFQLTERGEYWLDVGAYLAYEWSPKKDVADTIEARVLLAKDVGKFSHSMNIIAEKNVGSGQKAALKSTVLWGSRYRYSEMFEPGFEVSSDFGELDNTGSFNDQKHEIGPMAYGKVPLGLAQKADALKYRVGYLFGVSDAAPNGDAIAQLEYELHF